MASSPDERETPTDLNSDLNIEEVTGEDNTQFDQKTTVDSENTITNVEPVSDGKISVFLKATSDVAIMKKKRWQVDETKTVHWVITFIKKYLKLDEKDTIFLYVAQAFAPSPDQQIKNLYECFGAEGKLVLHYSKTPFWG